MTDAIPKGYKAVVVPHKTNEQIACNNWEKIGFIKGRQSCFKEVLKIIDDLFYTEFEELRAFPLVSINKIIKLKQELLKKLE